jgi:hypothetical protein
MMNGLKYIAVPGFVTRHLDLPERKALAQSQLRTILNSRCLSDFPLLTFTLIRRLSPVSTSSVAADLFTTSPFDRD